MKSQEPFSISVSTKVEAIAKLLSAEAASNRLGGFLPVVDEEKRLLGIITDSDYRRNLVSNKDARDAADVMNSNFVFAQHGTSLAKIAESVIKQSNLMGKDSLFPITYIPLLDNMKRLKRVIHVLELKPYLDEITREVFVYGQGFVGLTLSLVMASSGIKVFGIEKSREKIRFLKQGKVLVHEPYVSQILKDCFGQGFTIIDPSEVKYLQRPAFAAQRIFIVATGSPLDVDLTPNLDDIQEACADISRHLSFGDLVIIRSTVPIGTTKNLICNLLNKGSNLEAGSDFNLAYCPERTVEGDAIRELRELPQLIGGLSTQCAEKAATFFSGFVSSIVMMESLESAEIAKLASNTFRDVVFAFANELGSIANEWNLDINRLIKESNTGYSRNQIPQPSPGVGGPCLSKDSHILKFSTKQAKLISVARDVNEETTKWQTRRLLEYARQKNTRSLVAIGLAFKGIPETNDLRKSTGVEICKILRSQGLNIQVLDAVVLNDELAEIGLDNLSSTSDDVGAYLVLNNHPKNREILFEHLKNQNKLSRWLYDPWNLFNDFECKEYFTSRLTLSQLKELNLGKW